MILDFFRKKNECRHINIPADAEEAYCPDCGALVKNMWYIVRCECCGIKRAAHLEYNDIKTDTKFCPNCGGNGIYVQQLNKINFIDINYAILKQAVLSQKIVEWCQIWTEKEEEENTKLLQRL